MIKVDVSGEGMIFRKEFNDRVSYSTTLSKKDKEGTWTNAFIPIQFKKDVFIHHRTKIQLNSAWLTFYLTKEDKPVFYIFCNDFTELEVPDIKVEPKRPDKKAVKDEIPSGFSVLDEEDESGTLPF